MSNSKEEGEEPPKKKLFASGAQKRKLKEKKDLEAAASSSKKITLFFQPTESTSTTSRRNIADHNNSTITTTTDKSNSSQDSESAQSAPDTVPVPIISENTATPSLSSSDSESDSSESERENEEFIDISTETNNVTLFFSPPTHATILEKLNFVKKHPNQPTYSDCPMLPFNPKLYQRKLPNGELVNRNWLTYSVELNKLFCSICMVFSNVKHRQTFSSDGMSDFRHSTQRVKEHEVSLGHSQSVQAYFRAVSSQNIEVKINVDLTNQRKNDILNNREIIKRIIDIILFISKQQLAYRGKEESSSSLNKLDSKINRGNFLELCLLLAKYDNVMKAHINKISVRKQDSKQGRGSHLTFLSKTFVNKIIHSLVSFLKEKISSEIQKAKKFSVQIDSTQDVSVREQCAIIARYVYEGKVNERLLSLINVKKSSGLALYNHLDEELKSLNLEISNVIGCSFDGAANMSGQYNGLQAHIKNHSNYSVYTWCYAHVLNLVVCDTTDCLVKCKNLFGLLNRTAVFFSESYKRDSVWKEHQGNDFRTLKKICNTRWWSKAKALEVIFVSYQNISNELYSTLLSALKYIACDNVNEFDGKTSSEANSLLSAWTSFETLILSKSFLRIFEILTPASNYLQTAGLNFQVAFKIVMNAKIGIEKMIYNFEEIYNDTKKFIDFINEKPCIAENDILIEDNFPVQRTRKVKKMPGEDVSDEVTKITDQGPYKKFEIQTYKAIINQVTQSLKNRFENHKSIYDSFYFFDPRNFVQLITQCDVLDDSVFDEVSKLSGLPSFSIKNELICFAKNFKDLKNLTETEEFLCLPEGYVDEETEEAEPDDDDKIRSKKKCSGCLHCCLKILLKHNLHVGAYSHLYIVYKCLLTLSCTQVACERLFSKLKLVLTRLRSLLGQELVEAFIMLSSEADLLEGLDKDHIIDKIANSTPLLKKKLLI